MRQGVTVENNKEVAFDFIRDYDKRFGESWSDVTDELVNAFVVYANMVNENKKKRN